MKTIFAILMLLVASTVTAHNKVMVIPMVGDDLPECLISGVGVICDKKPTARIPIGKTVTCGQLVIHYSELYPNLRTAFLKSKELFSVL